MTTGQVVDRQGNPVTPVAPEQLTREQEVNLLQEMTHHPGWAVYQRLLQLNWEKAQKLLMNPEFARDHEGHNDEFLKGTYRAYTQSAELPNVAMQQYAAAQQLEQAKAAKAVADAKAGHNEPGFRGEALPPDFNEEGGPGDGGETPEGEAPARPDMPPADNGGEG